MLLLWIRVGFSGQSATPWSCGDGDGVVDGDLAVVVVMVVTTRRCLRGAHYVSGAVPSWQL